MGLLVLANDASLSLGGGTHELPAGGQCGLSEIAGANVGVDVNLGKVPGDLVAVGLLEPELARHEGVGEQHQASLGEVSLVGKVFRLNAKVVIPGVLGLGRYVLKGVTPLGL